MLNNLIALQIKLLADNATAPTDSVAAAKAGKFSSDMAQLKTMSLEDLINRLAESAVNFAINLAIAIVVFLVGRLIIRKICLLTSSIFIRRKIDRSLSVFVLSLLKMVLYFILIVTVIGILGIETTSFLALFASAGVAIGMALSGTLQNFAGGVLILLLKPYKIGDYIEAQGYAGTVKEIQIFFTVITTYDNKSISIPNGVLSTSSINNWTREDYRRVSWTVSISYGDSVDDARRAILEMFEGDSRIVKPGENANDASTEPTAAEIQAQEDIAPAAKPGRRTWGERWRDMLRRRHMEVQRRIAEREEEYDAALRSIMPVPDYTPKVLVGELGSSSVDLNVRAWTRTSDYWAVFYYYNERFYAELPGHGINFPFPQLDVHMQSK